MTDTSYQLHEEVLQAWLHLSTILSNRRIVNILSANEAIVCHLLLRQPENQPLTATDLCAQTKLLKSQMNRILQSLENKQMICRIPDEVDKRKAVICLQKDHLTPYWEDHETVIQLIDQIIQKIGADKAASAARQVHEIAQAITEILNKEQLT